MGSNLSHDEQAVSSKLLFSFQASAAGTEREFSAGAASSGRQEGQELAKAKPDGRIVIAVSR